MVAGNQTIRIDGHALIGNCRAAALVSTQGSIDWCCLPDFHSPSIFAAILDERKGGCFVIQPLQTLGVTQNYVGDTNVVQTIFNCNSGVIKVTDCFVAMEEKQKKTELFPDHEILRIVEGVEGLVKMRFEYYPRAFYGKSDFSLKSHGHLGVHFTFKENILVFQTTVEGFTFSKGNNKLAGEFFVGKGDKEVFSLSCSSQHPAIIPEVSTCAGLRLQATTDYWNNWISQCKYEGVFKSAVLRSVLTLKLLTHAPSGAIIAAPTTSLPEELKGVRNWDYRYCWLRDASFTVRVLIKLGYYDEAHAYMNWILHATQLTQPNLQVVYTIFGNTNIREQNCDWLRGYRHSVPVRIGNDAHDQFQLDIYGEVLNAVYTYSEIVNEFDKATVKFILGLGATICRKWREPDEGIWEIRGGRLQHTHSKAMACTGLDRLIRLCKRYNWKNAPLDEFIKARNEICDSIEQLGFDTEMNAYKKDYAGKELDASLLVLPLVNYCSASSPRMVSTIEQIERRLLKNGFVYRYISTDDGLPGKEGAFIVAGFWLIENLAKSGRVEEAIYLFQQTLNAAPKHQLLSEEIDPHTKEWLGNYPQGFSHIGLISAALSISENLQNKAKDYGAR